MRLPITPEKQNIAAGGSQTLASYAYDNGSPSP